MSILTKVTRYAVLLTAASLAMGADAALDYRILATSRTSTMQKELQEAGSQGMFCWG